MVTHQLIPSRATLHGTFNPDWAPVLTIDSGDTVIFQTLDARWSIEPPPDKSRAGARFAPRDDLRDNGHALCGPVAINGAMPGMVLVVQIGEIETGNWGWTISGGWNNGINERLGLASDEIRFHWDLNVERGIGTNQFGHSVSLSPFFGVMGMPGASTDPVPSWTPRPEGGNIDCKELISGTTLYLPIAIEGALFSAGDGHARQGDGEVASTAIECPIASAQLTFSLRNDLALAMPIARTRNSWITFGFHEDLDEAVLIAIDVMLDLMGREYELNRNTALALLSVAADVRVSQIVNGVKGVHVVLKDGEIGGLSPETASA